MKPIVDSRVVPTLTGVEHRFVDVKGRRVHVALAGHGDPVVLLHGFPQNWWEWREVVPALQGRYRLICMDFPGSGWSEATPGGYSREEIVADVVGVLDALETPRVRLICHDWGAIVGFSLCLTHPERVQAMVALAAPHPYIHFSRSMIPGMWRLWFQIVIALPGIGPRMLKGGGQRLPRYLLNAYAARPDAMSEKDRQVFLSQLRVPGQARAASAVYRHLILPEAVAITRGAYRDRRLQTPTLILAGAEDPALAPAMMGGYEQHADALTVEFVDGASHFIADDQPEVITDRITEFFRDN